MPVWLSGLPLSHRRCIHVTQTISELFHHVRCELRMLLNEKMEPPLIDCRQSAGGLRQSVGSTRTIIDQGHLADQRAWLCGLNHIITKPDVHFPFHNTYILSRLSPSRKRKSPVA